MDAASRARILLDAPETLERLEHILGEDDSIREVLARPSKAPAIRDWLISANVLSKQEIGQVLQPADAACSPRTASGSSSASCKPCSSPIRACSTTCPRPSPTRSPATSTRWCTPRPRGRTGTWGRPSPRRFKPGIAGGRRRTRRSMPGSRARAATASSSWCKDPIADDRAGGSTILRRLVKDNTTGWRERAKAYLAHARKFIARRAGLRLRRGHQGRAGQGVRLEL